MKSGWIASNIFKVVTLAAITIFLGCSRRAELGEKPTLRTFEAPFDQIWNAIVATAKEDQLDIEFSDRDGGLISSRWMSETRTFKDQGTGNTQIYPTRYRLSISLRRIPSPTLGSERVTISIFKDFQIKEGNRWRAFPSDLQTESTMIASIGKKLGQ